MYAAKSLGDAAANAESASQGRPDFCPPSRPALWQRKQFCCAMRKPSRTSRSCACGPRGAIAPNTIFSSRNSMRTTPHGICGFLGVRENLVAGRELRMRNHVGPHVKSVLLRILWPTGRRMAVHFEHQHGMMRHEIGTRVIRAVTVIANRDDHVRRGRCAKFARKIFKLHPANLGWAGKVCIVSYCEIHLGHGQKFIASDVARRSRRQARKRSAYF